MPAVVLFSGMPSPVRTALTVPLFTSKVAVLVKAEVPVPRIRPPPSSVTVPTVCAWSAPRSRRGRGAVDRQRGGRQGIVRPQRDGPSGDQGGAGVAIRPAEGESARADLGKRGGGVAGDRARKGRRCPVGAHGQRIAVHVNFAAGDPLERREDGGVAVHVQGCAGRDHDGAPHGNPRGHAGHQECSAAGIRKRLVEVDVAGGIQPERIPYAEHLDARVPARGRIVVRSAAAGAVAHAELERMVTGRQRDVGLDQRVVGRAVEHDGAVDLDPCAVVEALGESILGIGTGGIDDVTAVDPGVVVAPAGAAVGLDGGKLHGRGIADLGIRRGPVVGRVDETFVQSR